MLSLRQKLAQLLIVGFDGEHLDPRSNFYQCLSTTGIGGVISFDKAFHKNAMSKNIVSMSQVSKLNTDIRHLCFDSIGVEPIISVDFEGGAVNRFTSLTACPNAPSAAVLAGLSMEDFNAVVAGMAQWLASLGFNVNFAPVVDLSLEKKDGIIGSMQRSFGASATEVLRHAISFSKIHAQYNIGTCFKHFPGHGSAVKDSHTGYVDVTDTFHLDEVIPYTHLKDYADLPIAVMTAHVINAHFDPSGKPASLSTPMLSSFLRKKYGYNGLIISDDLQMRAISDHYSIDEAMIAALNAGCDMLIIGNQLGSHPPEALILELEKAVQKQFVSLERIDTALQRIISYKTQIACKSTLEFEPLCI